MKPIIILFLICYFDICSLSAQDIEAITSSGRKVILSPKGTWQYDSLRITSLYKGKGNKEINIIANEKPTLSNAELARDTLSSLSKYFLDYKKYCVLNERDSTSAGNAEWANKVPELKMVEGKNTGIVKYIYETFNNAACSKEYNFSIRVIFKVNCRGEIYDVRFKTDTDKLTKAKYCLDEFYKFTNAVYESMKKVNKISMTPPYYKDKRYQGKLNYSDFVVVYTSSIERGLIIGCKEKINISFRKEVF